MGINNYHTADTHDNSFADRPFKPNRKFSLSELWGPNFDLDSSRYEDEKFTLLPCYNETPCEHCGMLSRYMDLIFIAVDGACRGNGTPNAKSAIGVYFAEDSPHNISLPIHGILQTSQSAELAACLMALRKVNEIWHEFPSGLHEVVIKADSEYIVKGMTEWVFKWRKSGYRNARGLPVINAELFKSIDRMVSKLNDATPRVEVLFWHVPRARNQKADGLANLGFQSRYSIEIS